MKRTVIILIVALLGVLAGLSIALATDTYTLKFPPDLKSFVDKTGTQYTPDANSLTTITDISLLPPFLYAGFIPVDMFPTVLYRNNTVYTVSDNSTTDTCSMTLPINLLQPGRSLRITAGGTVAGTGFTKPIILYLSNGAVSTISLPTTAINEWACEWLVNEYTDYAHQNILGSCKAGTVAGGTSSTSVEAVKATKTLSAAATLKFQLTNHDVDSIVQTYATVELLP